MKKRVLSLVLALVTLFSLCVPAFAADDGSDAQLETANMTVEGKNDVGEPELGQEEDPASEAPAGPEDAVPPETDQGVAGQEETPDSPKSATDLEGVWVHLGNCGDGGAYVGWTLNSSGELSIGGNGAMKDYDYENAPWFDAIEEEGIELGSRFIRKITISDGVTHIGNSAFWWTGATSITIPGTVTSIGNYAFDGCTELTSVTIPGSVKTIGKYAFDSCYSLKNVTIGEGVTSIGEAAFMGTAITSVTIPGTVKTIADGQMEGDVFYTGAFAYCRDLKSVTIKEGVTSIGDYTFWYSGVTSVTIPRSVTRIGEWAFDECYSLKAIYGYPGSAAEAYAKEYGYRFEAIDVPVTPTPGPDIPSTPDPKPQKNGWEKEGNKWYYYSDGVKLRSSFINEASNSYYVDETGARVTSWREINSQWYFFKEDGAMKRGWYLESEKRRYFFDFETGVMATGLKEIGDNVWYYFSEKHDGSFGVMYTGWKKLNNVDYYFGGFSSKKVGAMVRNDWVYDGGKQYYMGDDGRICSGLTTVGSETFYLNTKHDGFFGAVLTGWRQIGNEKYYFNPKHDGHYGAMQKGWLLLNNKWYYFRPEDGKMLHGVKCTIEDVPYCFRDNGVMATGWIRLQNGDYHYAWNWGGLAVNAWVKDSTGDCYIKSDTYMARNETMTIDGVKYTFDNYGHVVKKESVAKRPLDNLSAVPYILQAKNQCYVTAFTMAVNLIEGGNHHNVDEFRDKDPRYPDRLTGVAGRTFTGTDGTYKVVQNPNSSVWETEAAIVDAIKRGVPIVVTVQGNIGTHRLLVVGIDANTSDYLVVDPGRGDPTKRWPTTGDKPDVMENLSLDAAKTSMKSISWDSSGARYTLKYGAYITFEKQ